MEEFLKGELNLIHTANTFLLPYLLLLYFISTLTENMNFEMKFLHTPYELFVQTFDDDENL